jgi:hypothetical protein
MYAVQTTMLIAGGVATSVGLLLFTAVLADNLRRAVSLPIVAVYGWTALVALVLLVILGLLLVLDYEIAILSDHGAVALAHMILGGFGFMGMLVLGFSHVLVPMFALSSAPPKAPSLIGFALALAGIALGSIGALAGNDLVLALAALAGLGATAVHLWLMQRVLAEGMRKRLGLSFTLIRAAWALLPVTLLVGLAAILDLAGPNGATLFGFLLLGGWLLTFLLGVLQRILPFLASMHASPVSRTPNSNGTASLALRMHAACHGMALTLIAAAIVMDVAWLGQAGGAIGLIGAIIFAWFTANVIQRLARTHRS